jgi:hypothetical protein
VYVDESYIHRFHSHGFSWFHPDDEEVPTSAHYAHRDVGGEGRALRRTSRGGYTDRDSDVIYVYYADADEDDDVLTWGCTSLWVAIMKMTRKVMCCGRPCHGAAREHGVPDHPKAGLYTGGGREIDPYAGLVHISATSRLAAIRVPQYLFAPCPSACATRGLDCGSASGDLRCFGRGFCNGTMSTQSPVSALSRAPKAVGCLDLTRPRSVLLREGSWWLKRAPKNICRD